MVIRCPGRPLGHATNFLGGVADVLQDKTRSCNISLDHLAELCDVALYIDDAQVSQISYRERRHARTRPTRSGSPASPIPSPRTSWAGPDATAPPALAHCSGICHLADSARQGCSTSHADAVTLTA